MKWYKSRLVWTGVITILYGLAKGFGFDAELTPGALETTLGIVVVLLRLVTKEEIILQ